MFSKTDYTFNPVQSSPTIKKANGMQHIHQRKSCELADVKDACTLSYISLDMPFTQF